VIKEISNFVEQIPENYLTDGLIPSEGLHIWIKLDGSGNIIEKKSWLIKKNSNPFEIDKFYELGKRDSYSKWISNNKTMDAGGDGKKMQILSTTPFSLFFSRKSYDDGQIFIKIAPYFKNLVNLSPSDEALEFTLEEINRIQNIENFLQSSLKSILLDIKEFHKLQKKEYIKIYFDEDEELIKKAYNRYLACKLFLVDNDQLNVTDKKNIKYGMVEFLSTLNVSKKPFLTHHTSSFLINNRFEPRYHIGAYKFRKLLEAKKLPKPLPIFIDQEELNHKVVELYNREGLLSYQKIIQKIISEHQKDLENYYLIFWSRSKDLIINDFDYVNRFQYKLNHFEIKNVMELVNQDKSLVKDYMLDNVFELEKLFDSKLFYQIQKNTGYRFGFLMKNYFNPEIAASKGYELRSITKTNLLKYRKVLYDLVYKSRFETFRENHFNELMISTVLDNIKMNNDFKDNYKIKELLNIFFSLNKNFGGNDMASKIPILREKLKTLLDNSEAHIESDEEFAFDAGQLIYYIIYQSEASNKTHALLEPYITKNDPMLFKLAITRGIDQYKHKLPYGTKKFQKLASEILGWDSSSKIKDLLPIILAGYFSNSLLFESSK